MEFFISGVILRHSKSPNAINEEIKAHMVKWSANAKTFSPLQANDQMPWFALTSSAYYFPL